MTGEREANGQIKIPQWVVYVMVAAISLGISAFVSYSAQSAAINARVAVGETRLDVLEKRQNDDRAESERWRVRIEEKLDQLLRRP